MSSQCIKQLCKIIVVVDCIFVFFTESDLESFFDPSLNKVRVCMCMRTMRPTVIRAPPLCPLGLDNFGRCGNDNVETHWCCDR